MTRKPRQIHLKYAEKRDVVFFFGAGASVAAGIPLQEDILREALSQSRVRDSQAGRELIRFLQRFFALNRRLYPMPSLEDVFAFLDYFISRNEHLDSVYSVSQLRKIQECFVRIIHYTIGQRRTNNASTHRAFWDVVGVTNRNVSIVSLNYDSVLEAAFGLYPEHAYIDYCINLLNYDYEEVPAFYWWINPREPVPRFGEENPVPIKILKLHGSLDWKFCRACRGVLLTPWSTEIDLEQGAFFSPPGDDILPSELLCPVDGCRFETLILPPSYIKDLRNPVVSTIGSEIEQEIRIAKKVVLIGYSLPDADIHLRALFAKSLSRDTQVVVVNPDNCDALQARYACLAQRVSFLNHTFESFVLSESLGDILKGTGA